MEPLGRGGWVRARDAGESEMNGNDILSREALVGRFKRLTEVELPARAREERWALRLDHCFKRVCLDWACQDCWYGHIQRPAERNMGDETLARAARCAEEILEGGSAVLKERNAASLRWRGKHRGELRGASELRREGGR